MMKIVTLIFQALFFHSLCFSIPTTVQASPGDYVVVLHGIARSAGSMENLSEYIEGRGYKILNVDYPSTDHSLEKLVEKIRHQVTRFNQDKNRKLHFVTHSMGGILVRGLLNQYHPENLGRVVMLAPPNLGSQATDFWKDNWLYQKIYGPAGQQLTTDQSRIKKFLGQVNYELGIIAGDRSIDPLHSFIIPGPDDGKVGISKTMLEGMKDHKIIHATHTFIMNNPEAQKLAVSFISNGKF
jgi:triacylglycerol lipase